MSKDKRKPEPMINSCKAFKVKLSNGTRIACTYKNIQGHTVMDLWATDANGKHISSRSLKTCCMSSENKVAKIHNLINDLKLEIVCHEANALKSNKIRTSCDVLEYVNKRYNELKVEKA